MIPISRLSVGEREAAAVADVVRSGWIAQGKRTEHFESLVARYVGARYAVATSSCTTALHLALVAAGIGPGDEVICPSYSFIATANAIVYAGATPVFADIDLATYNISVSELERVLTPRTRAILPVSQIGLPANLPAIIAFARANNLVVIEDAAPSLGSSIDGRMVGSFSDFTCFSFDARKILTTGEGGIITTDNEVAAARLGRLRAHSTSASMMARHASSSVVLETYPEVGFNYRMTDMQAAMGIVQMEQVETFIEARRRLAGRYREAFAHESRLVLPSEPPGYRHVYQSYCVLLDDRVPRLAVMEAMAARGVATRRITAIHLEPAYRERFPSLVLPATAKANSNAMLIPMYATMTDSEQDTVISALQSALDEAVKKPRIAAVG